MGVPIPSPVTPPYQSTQFNLTLLYLLHLSLSPTFSPLAPTVHVCHLYYYIQLHIMSLPRSSRPEAPAASVPAPTSSRSVSSSIPLKPDPSNTVPFSWSCKCTNVILKGRIHKDLEELVQRPKSSDSKPGGSLTSAWINSTGEHCVSLHTCLDSTPD